MVQALEGPEVPKGTNNVTWKMKVWKMKTKLVSIKEMKQFLTLIESPILTHQESIQTTEYTLNNK
jgi:hypothetical protein